MLIGDIERPFTLTEAYAIKHPFVAFPIWVRRDPALPGAYTDEGKTYRIESNYLTKLKFPALL